MTKQQAPVVTHETGPETWQPTPEAQTEAQGLLEDTAALERIGIREDRYEDIARALYVIVDPDGIEPRLLDEFKIHIDNFDVLHRPTKLPEEYAEMTAYVDVFSLLSKKESFALLRDCRQLKDDEEYFMLSMQDTTRLADQQRQIINGVRETAKEQDQQNNNFADVKFEEQIASTLDTSSDSLSDFSATRGEYHYANSVISDTDPKAVKILGREIKDPRRQLQTKWQEIIENKVLELSAEAAREESVRENAASLDDDILDEAIDEVFGEKLVDAFDEEQIDALAKDILDDRDKYPSLETLMTIEDEDPELFEVCNMYIGELKSMGLGASFVDFDTLTVQELEQFHTSAEKIISSVKEAKNDEELSALLTGRIMDYGQAAVRQIYNKSGKEARHNPVVKWINDKVKAYEKGTRYHTGHLPNLTTLQDLALHIKDVVQPKITATQVDADLEMSNVDNLLENEGITKKQAVVTKILAMDALVDVLPERTSLARDRAKERSAKLLDFFSTNSNLIRTSDMPRSIKEKLEWVSVAAGERTDRIASTQVVAFNEGNILDILSYISELKVQSNTHD